MTREAVDDAILATMIVGEIEGHFLVPDYQRGYRWGESEVTRLLDDVRASAGMPYFLQPVVVKSIGDDKWELIDGQQRLTTLLLILQYIQREALPTAQPRYTMEYQTRAEIQKYLTDLGPDKRERNIDFFHIFQAYECIRHWFERQHNPLQAALDFYTASSKTLQIIWYEAPEHVDSKELFRRLNVGRIPLTDAELVKALLLSQFRATDGHSDRAHQVAAQWDVIERDLRKPELWAFATNKSHEEATHIDLLLNALADRIERPPLGPRPKFHTFETLRPAIESTPKKVWDDIQDLHSLIVGWYEESTLYHWIGYLIATGDRFASILTLAQAVTRSQFTTALKLRIRNRLGRSAEQVKELTYPAAKCSEVLLLMNVEAVRRRTASSERYSFSAHASGAWSLEHIHAQNAEPLRTADQWTEWLRRHREALNGMPVTNPAERAALLTDVEEALAASLLTTGRFRSLEQRMVREFSANGSDSEEEVHSISNLALLSCGVNSTLSNSVFEVKRREIIRRDKDGDYIPTCTRDAFLKYYTESGAQQIHYWGPEDREGYLSAILGLIEPFLLSEDKS